MLYFFFKYDHDLLIIYKKKPRMILLEMHVIHKQNIDCLKDSSVLMIMNLWRNHSENACMVDSLHFSPRWCEHPIILLSAIFYSDLIEKFQTYSIPIMYNPLLILIPPELPRRYLFSSMQCPVNCNTAVAICNDLKSDFVNVSLVREWL